MSLASCVRNSNLHLKKSCLEFQNFLILQKFDPLLTLVRRSELSTSDVNKCRECICAFIANKDSKEPLTAKTIDCVKFKNPLSRQGIWEEKLNETLKKCLLKYLKSKT